MRQILEFLEKGTMTIREDTVLPLHQTANYLRSLSSYQQLQRYTSILYFY